jgi:hypothetical protein
MTQNKGWFVNDNEVVMWKELILFLWLIPVTLSMCVLQLMIGKQYLNSALNKFVRTLEEN